MLSKTSFVILGLLNEERLSAYEMLKKIEERHMKYWLPIGNTTLYETALRLEKKEWIKGEKQGTNKVIYQLTNEGKEELVDTLRTLFTRVDYDTIWFSLAALFCNVLDSNQLQDLIGKRRILLEEYYNGIQEQYNWMKQNRVPFAGICSIERMLKVIVLEQETLERIADKDRKERGMHE